MNREAPSVIDPAKLAARLRAAQNRSFTGRPSRSIADPSFKAKRLDQVERVTLNPAGAVTVELIDDAAFDDAAFEPATPAPPDPAQLLADAQAQGHAAGRAEGHAAGLTEGRAAAEADFAAARDAFLAVARNLALQGPDLSDQLAALMATAVRDLAAQRAGQAIDALPKPFLTRIAKLADRVAQGMRSVTLRLNPDDLTALAPHLAGTDLDGAVLTPDPTMARGDVEIRADGIRLADMLEAK